MKTIAQYPAGSLVLLLFFSGCFSPGYRINKNPGLFESFPLDVQKNIRQGNIDADYTKDMVFLAKGKPDREYTRKTRDKSTDIWSYITIIYRTERQRAPGTFKVRGPEGRFRTVHDTVWVDVKHEQEYEKLRIEFEDGRVVAIEEIIE